MILNAVYFTILMPLSIHGAHSAPIDVNKPVFVKATIDLARIIGLPSSKAAKAYSLKIQSPDPMLKQIIISPDTVSDRKLFFRSYFK